MEIRGEFVNKEFVNKRDKTSTFVNENLNKNIIYTTVDGAFFGLGIGMVPLATTLTYFVSQYIHSNVLIGLLTTMNAFLLNLPQLFTARYIESMANNRKLILFSGFIQRFAWILMGTIVLIVQNKMIMMVLFYFAYGFFSLVSGIVGVAWMDMIAKVIPINIRGRVFGIRTFLCSMVEFIGALLSVYILEKFYTPYNYSILFYLVGAFLFISMIFLAKMKEPNVIRQTNIEPLPVYLKKLAKILKEDKTFLYFIIALSIALIGGAAAAFRIVYAKNIMNITAKDVAFLTLLWVMSRAVSSFVWGFVNDRKSYRFTMILAHLIQVMSFFLMNFIDSSSMLVLYVVFVIHGIWEGAIFVTQNNFIIELGGEKHRATYLGLSAILFTPASAIGPIIMGAMIDLFNYQTTFWLAGVLMIGTAFTLHKKVCTNNL